MVGDLYMEIKGMVYCMFEQSGVFKNEFKKLGINAVDMDIQNNFNETDFVIDLFAEIENAYENKPSVFDKITKDDLIVAFYPCIYFCSNSQMAFSLGCHNYKKLNNEEKIREILKRSDNRKEYYDRLIKFVGVCLKKKLRMIFENPFAMQTYLKANFLKAPDLIDNDRSLRGDYFKKPTAYWFWNCKHTYGESFQQDKEVRRIADCKHLRGGGLCSEERSMISPDYARNFICDFILGKEQDFGQMKLF